MLTLFTALTYVKPFQKSKCSKCSLTFPEPAVGIILRGGGRRVESCSGWVEIFHDRKKDNHMENKTVLFYFLQKYMN